MPALVAKSYENLEQVTDIYQVNGRDYVKVRMPNGNLKQVRAYSEKEYRKYNPEVKVIQPAKSQREIFGFGEAGFIWVFKGDTYAALDWFRFEPTRYARPFGWYLPSDIPLPEPLPAGITPVKLPWDAVKANDYKLKSEKELTDIVAEYIYEPGTSQWLGKVGDRLRDIEVTCTRKMLLQSMYGDSTMFLFIDSDGNQFNWITSSSQNIEEGDKCIITGTIKELTTYRNVKQNVLKNCRIKEIEESTF